jgi:hypothetical protein
MVKKKYCHRCFPLDDIRPWGIIVAPAQKFCWRHNCIWSFRRVSKYIPSGSHHTSDLSIFGRVCSRSYHQGFACFNPNLFIRNLGLFLDNFVVEWWPESLDEWGSMTGPRVYLIIFETAVDFIEDSPPSSQHCTGTPWEDSIYSRRRAPEFLRNQSYFPFRLDMWQFGSDLQEDFPVCFELDEDEFRKNSLDGPGRCWQPLGRSDIYRPGSLWIDHPQFRLYPDWQFL